jgi:hypothetical protein
MDVMDVGLENLIVLGVAVVLAVWWVVSHPRKRQQ